MYLNTVFQIVYMQINSGKYTGWYWYFCAKFNNMGRKARG
jgi:hypothetical protein